MVKDTQSIKDFLETEIVDKESIHYAIDLLAEICGEKADHLRTNWQDENSASAWDELADYLQETSANINQVSGL